MCGRSRSKVCTQTRCLFLFESILACTSHSYVLPRSACSGNHHPECHSQAWWQARYYRWLVDQPHLFPKPPSSRHLHDSQPGSSNPGNFQKSGAHWSHLLPATPGLQEHSPSIEHCILIDPIKTTYKLLPYYSRTLKLPSGWQSHGSQAWRPSLSFTRER